MKDILKIDIKFILIIVLALILLIDKCFLSNNNKNVTNGQTITVDGKKYEVIKHDVDTQYIPVTTTIVKKGKNIYHDTTIFVPIPTKISIDTLQILKNYFAKNVRKDTLYLNDSLGFVSVTDTIQENDILMRTWSSKYFKTIIIDKTIVKELPKHQVYAGFNTNFDKTNLINSIGGNLILKTKKDMLYQIGIGVNNNGTTNLIPYVGIGVAWKIKFK